MTPSFRWSLSPEFALALECCAEFKTERMRTAAELAKDVDWDRFLAVCRRHRVQGLVVKSLGKLDLFLPAEVRAELRLDANQIAQNGLVAAKISADLMRLFAEAEIPLIFVKGLSVSKLAYGEAFVKMNSDIDILVPRKCISQSAKVLRRLGYKQALPRNHDLNSWHAVWKESIWTLEGSPPIELHTSLADNRCLIPSIGISSPCQLVTVAPGIALPTLADAELLAYLCVHAASSAWFRLKWIADIAALLSHQEGTALERTISGALRLGAGRALPATLLLVQRLFDIAVFSQAQIEAVSQKDRWLAELGLRELLNDREPTERLIGTAAIHLCQFLLLPGVKFKASQFALQARKTLMSAE